jgi:hypothetical protein
MALSRHKRDSDPLDEAVQSFPAVWRRRRQYRGSDLYLKAVDTPPNRPDCVAEMTDPLFRLRAADMLGALMWRLTPLYGLVIAVPLGLTSCHSAYEGKKLNEEGELDGAEGIPYVLRRPEYKLVRDTTSKPPRYKVEVGYVPDPKQRYTLRLSPAITAAVTFDMALGADGQLTSASNELTDQIVPTTKAVLSFAATLVGTAVGAATGVSAPSEALASFGEKPEPQRVECLDHPTDARVAYCAIHSVSCAPAAKEELKTRVGNEFFNPPPGSTVYKAGG